MLEPKEYIRKYGIEQAREFYKRIENKPMYSFNADMPRKYKEMINSHDLVEKMGGIECLKDIALYGITQEKFRDQLKQAIADVESCQ